MVTNSLRFPSIIQWQNMFWCLPFFSSQFLQKSLWYISRRRTWASIMFLTIDKYSYILLHYSLISKSYGGNFYRYYFSLKRTTIIRWWMERSNTPQTESVKPWTTFPGGIINVSIQYLLFNTSSGIAYVVALV